MALSYPQLATKKKPAMSVFKPTSSMSGAKPMPNMVAGPSSKAPNMSPLNMSVAPKAPVTPYSIHGQATPVRPPLPSSSLPQIKPPVAGASNIPMVTSSNGTKPVLPNIQNTNQNNIPTPKQSVPSPIMPPQTDLKAGFIQTPPPTLPNTTNQSDNTQSGTVAPTPPPLPSLSPETQKVLDSANKAYEESLRISPEELSTQADIDRLQESMTLGINKAREQAIPMEFITGQAAAIERRAQAFGETLERKLARQQAQRVASLEASKFALERADKKADEEKAIAETRRQEQRAEEKEKKSLSAPREVSKGQSIVQFNPVTGQYEEVYKAPEDVEAPKPIQIDGKLVQLNPATGKYEAVYSAEEKPDKPVEIDGKLVQFNPKTGQYETVYQSGSQGTGLTPEQYADAARKGYVTKDQLNLYSQIVSNGQQAPALKETSAEQKKLSSLVSVGLDSIKTIRDNVNNSIGRGRLFDGIYQAAEANLVDTIGRLRSGGAITEDEEKRFLSLLPEFGQLDSTSNYKLDQLEKLLKVAGGIDEQNNVNNNQSYQSIDEFYRAANPTQRAEIMKMLDEGIPEQKILEALRFKQEAQTSLKGSNIKLGSRLARVNNNPGNLRYAGQPGAEQGEGGFARFSSPEAGFQALERQISLDASRGLTLAQFINKFAPPTENDTNLYINQMIQALGASPNTKIKDIDTRKLAIAMAKKESSTIIG